MHCLDCGSSWRVFGTLINNSAETNQGQSKKTRIKKLTEDISFQSYEPEKPFVSFSNRFKTHIPSYKPGFGTLMACVGAGILFLGLYVSVSFLEKQTPAMPSDALYISEIEIEELVRENGDKVFTVKGLVANPTSLSKPIPPIAIILRKQNGSEITRWHYNSSLAGLKAGGKSRFASSIQYDTPIVAYAEAVFK
jgi:hypothetical protein